MQNCTKQSLISFGGRKHHARRSHVTLDQSAVHGSIAARHRLLEFSFDRSWSRRGLSIVRGVVISDW